MASKKQVFVTRHFPGAGLAMLKKAGFKVSVYEKDQIIPRNELLKRIKGQDAVLTLLTDRVDEQFFAAAGPQLKIVANYAVGFDNINIAAAKSHGVMITNTPGKLISYAVAEHTFALMLACAKRLVEADRYTRQGKYHGWSPVLLVGTLLRGKTLGIIGTGNIGSEVAKMAYAFGMKILYQDLKRNWQLEKDVQAKFMTKDQLLKNSDFISLHVPLLPATFHLLKAGDFKKMKKSAIVINTSRGPIIDEKALNIALEKGIIGGAGIDVYECEPAIDCDLSDTHELRKQDNIVLTPHTASAALEARAEMGELAAANIIAALRGKKPKNLLK